MVIATGIDNEMFQLASDFAGQSNAHIFLTGRAGTGKTTFLKHIREQSIKETVIVAPTGVAAINAGGATIHSFFQLPFSPFLPGHADTPSPSNDRHSLLGKIKINRDRIRVFRQLELLIIDEISMVRCDVLDAIDTVLRHYRHKPSEAFGGVQVLLIGDMYQLPPVVDDAEWNLLSRFYHSPYFFDSKVIQQCRPVYIEFEKIYRQQDTEFIDLLNQVRNNALKPGGLKLLESLYDPAFRFNSEDGYIVLTTHNYKADSINKAELDRLKKKSFSFKAAIEGDFSEKAYPADESLLLKEGAQVMFVKNDKEKTRRYFNGKIGTVTRIADDSIFVQCKDEDEIEVLKETWENIRYSLNKQTNRIEEEVIGSFTQFPLRLAWAITIHKSQGLTFQKAVIDAGAAFAAGQVYVALSRCTSPAGIVLQSRINPASLVCDERITRYPESRAGIQQLKRMLQQSKKQFQQTVLQELFDMATIRALFTAMQQLLQDNKKDFNEAVWTWVDEAAQKLSSIDAVATKFKLQLDQLFTNPMVPEENTALQDRLKEASRYFSQELIQLTGILTGSPAVTDSKIQAKNYNDAIRELVIAIAKKKHLLEDLSNGFNIEKYYTRKKNFVAPVVAVNAYATASAEKTDIAHPELHYLLRQLRNKLCEQKNVPVYMVASTKSIDEMVMYLPQTTADLTRISGFGKAKAAQYGQQFLEIINDYCEQHQLDTLIGTKTSSKRPEKENKEPKTDTKALTYTLFKEGKSIAEIAKERNLATSTIEGHLAFYVSRGMIPVNELVSTEKLLIIEPHISNLEHGAPITPLKQQLDAQVSYGELRLAIAAKAWERMKDAV